jgi:hypothetical protein
MEPIVPDTYSFRLPSGATLRVVTRSLYAGSDPSASIAGDAVEIAMGETPFVSMTTLASQLEQVAAEIRTVARRLPQ